MGVPQKLTAELPYDWALSLLGIYLKLENTNMKRYMHPIFHYGTIYNSQDMEASQVSISGWMEKADKVCLYNGIRLSHKKDEILPFVTKRMAP